MVIAVAFKIAAGGLDGRPAETMAHALPAKILESSGGGRVKPCTRSTPVYYAGSTTQSRNYVGETPRTTMTTLRC